MNVHSLSNPTSAAISLRYSWVALRCLRTLGANPDKDARLHRKLWHSAQRDAPVLSNVSRHGVQDFVSHTASTACETTGAGCAAGSNPANGSGVGCPMNWKIAATTLKKHVA